MFQALRLYLENIEALTNSLGSQKRSPLSIIQLTYQRAQGLAQVRAATAPVQRRKRILVREVFVADYSGKCQIYIIEVKKLHQLQVIVLKRFPQKLWCDRLSIVHSSLRAIIVQSSIDDNSFFTIHTSVGTSKIDRPYSSGLAYRSVNHHFFPRSPPAVCVGLAGMNQQAERLTIPVTTTGMFALSNSLSHVSSAAFTQARLSPGSSSAQGCSGLLTPISRCGTAFISRCGAATNLSRY